MRIGKLDEITDIRLNTSRSNHIFQEDKKKIEARVGRDMFWRGEDVSQKSEKVGKKNPALIWKDVGI